MKVIFRVPTGLRHKFFVQYCNKRGIHLKSLFSIFECLYFEIEEEMEEINALCSITKCSFTTEQELEQKRKKRTQNYQSIYGEI